MTNREKVIYNLERCTCHVPDACRDCGYDNHEYNECVEKLLRDALDLLKEQETREQCIKTKCVICPHCEHCDVDENGLLKEQEAVKPRFVDGNRNHFVKCGNCNFDLMHGMNFCPHCGQAVKWE